MDSPTGPIIELDSVTIQRGDTTALADASLSIAPGDIVGILGPNGAGKTTMLEAIQGYLSPQAGSVHPAVSRSARFDSVDQRRDGHDRSHVTR